MQISIIYTKRRKLLMVHAVCEVTGFEGREDLGSRLTKNGVEMI